MKSKEEETAIRGRSPLDSCLEQLHELDEYYTIARESLQREVALGVFLIPNESQLKAKKLPSNEETLNSDINVAEACHRMLKAGMLPGTPESVKFVEI